MHERESLGIEQLTKTTHSRFRATTDIAPASTLHHHWVIAAARAVPHRRGHTPVCPQAALHTFLECEYPFPSRSESTPNKQATIGPRLAAERITS